MRGQRASIYFQAQTAVAPELGTRTIESRMRPSSEFMAAVSAAVLEPRAPVETMMFKCFVNCDPVKVKPNFIFGMHFFRSYLSKLL